MFRLASSASVGLAAVGLVLARGLGLHPENETTLSRR